MLPEFIAFANELADRAGIVIRPLYGSDITVETKTDQSPVTIADREAERMMREAILQRYPNHGVWGEEFGKYQAEAKYCWVLDPIDGTRAFIAGTPTFGTLISLTRLGVPVLGVIDQPITKERWVGMSVGTTLNGTLCNTRACGGLAEAMLSTTSSALFDAQGKTRFDDIRKQVRETTYGLDCYAYARLANGEIDLVIESGLKPHDFCALRPVVEHAGGIMTDWQGNPLTLSSDGNVVAAGDKRVHEQALKVLNS